MSWKNWETEPTASTWKAAVEAVRSASLEFRSQLDSAPEMEVSGPRWDEPDVEIHWNTGNIHRNIHMFLSGEAWPLEISFEGAAWIEPPAPGASRTIRNWAETRHLPKATDAEQLRQLVKDNLPAAYNIVNSLELSAARWSGAHAD